MKIYKNLKSNQLFRFVTMPNFDEVRLYNDDANIGFNIPVEEFNEDYEFIGFKESILSEGVKHDQEKPRIDLIDCEFAEGMGRVLAFGSKKYAAHNWRKGLHYSRLIRAGLGHIFRFAKGETLDPETGESHLLHAACCVMFLFWMSEHRKDLDDRYKLPEETNNGQ